jgi:hypothetical protein
MEADISEELEQELKRCHLNNELVLISNRHMGYINIIFAKDGLGIHQKGLLWNAIMHSIKSLRIH